MLEPDNESKKRYDMIDTSVQSFKILLSDIPYLLKLMLFPVIIKIICYIIVHFYGLENDIIKQNLIMIPAFIAEGWLVVQWLRTVGLNERWPYKYQISISGEISNRPRIKAILSSIQIYVLIKLAMGALVAIALYYKAGLAVDGEQKSGSAIGFILAFAVLGLILWGYRLLWLFIPLSMNYPIKAFIKDVGGLMGSIKIIGMNLICTMPIYLILTIAVTIIFTVLNAVGIDDESSISGFILIIISSIGEIIISVLCATAVLLAFKDLMVKK